MKLVLSGDLHLGRTSTKLPPSWRTAGRSIEGWFLLVEATIREQADILLLSGDILDNRNALWESMGPFQEGIKRLQAAGIRCLAVSGNHDATSLPDLTTSLPRDHFRLLGKNGQWERETVFENGKAVLHIDGWSFPGPTVQQDPTMDYDVPKVHDGVPVLAMVHGDPGVPDSIYAPLSLSRLQSLPVSAWLLGHIHRANLSEGSPWILMPGSPHPLDPGEPGAHHAWICELKDGSLQIPTPFCRASLRYEEVFVELSPEMPLSIENLVTHLSKAVQKIESVSHLVIRVHLKGMCRDVPLLESLLENMEDWTLPGVAIESVRIDVHPELDVEEVAKSGPVQALLVEALRDPPQEIEARLEALCKRLSQQNEFSGKELPPPVPDDVPTTRLLEKILRATQEQLS